MTRTSSITIFHIIWLTATAGVACFVFSVVDGRLITRIVVALGAAVVALILLHVVIVYIVAALLIPRMKAGSYWSREVDSYMASVFPGKSGNPSGGA